MNIYSLAYPPSPPAYFYDIANAMGSTHSLFYSPTFTIPYGSPDQAQIGTRQTIRMNVPYLAAICLEFAL